MMVHRLVLRSVSLACLVLLSACGGGDDAGLSVVTAPRGQALSVGAALTPSAAVGVALTQQITAASTDARFSLAAEAPVGMTVNPVTGRLYWTPTPDQGGRTVQVSVEVSGSLTTTVPVTITVAAGTLALTQAYFIAPNGSNTTGDGSWSKPYADTRPLCDNKDPAKIIRPGSTVYYRGGTYFNPGFGSGLNPASIPDITCKGTATAPIVLRPWGNERPKIKFDAFTGIKLTGRFLTFQGFEIEGIAQDITYEQAIADWWTGSKYFNGGGLVVAGPGVTVADNLVHDTPAAGIDTEPEADLVQITGNIVFNSSWWSTRGTTAFGLVSINRAPDARTADNADTRITVRNNLAFASESRLYSRIMSKGYANLTVDEGSALLIQANAGSYDRGYVVEDNTFLYNGKGASLRADKIEFRRNTMYLNGTTMLSDGAGIRSQAATNATVEANAVQVRDQKAAVYFTTDTTLLGCTGNVLAGALLTPGLCGNAALNRTVSASTPVFVQPEAGDFRVNAQAFPGVVGADPTVFDALKTRLADYGYRIAPTGFQVPYDAMRQRILNSVPAGGQLVQQDAVTWWVYFPNTSNPTGKTAFKLFW